MRLYKILLGALTVVLAVVSSCASFSAEDEFMLKNLDNKAKAKVLVEQGISWYGEAVKNRDDIDRLPNALETFRVAARFDPNNADALRYIGLAQALLDSRYKESIAEAKQLLAKKTRRSDEDYRLVLLTQRVVRLQPEAADAKYLSEQTSQVRNRLFTQEIDKASTRLDSIDNKSSDKTIETALIDSLAFVEKILQLDPQQGNALALRSKLYAGMHAQIRKHLDAIPSLMESISYTAAKNRIASAEDLDEKSGMILTSEIRQHAFTLQFKWAQYLFDRKDFDGASEHIASALSYKAEPEAIVLKNKIATQRDDIQSRTGFDKDLAAADAALSKNDWVSANKILLALTVLTNDSAKLSQLAERTKKIKDALGSLYKKGVDEYKAERYPGAIEALQVVVTIDDAFENAVDYLEKAKAKQKILEKY